MALIEHRNSGRYHPPKSEQDKARAGMSVEGQKRRFDNLPVTSGLPPTSDFADSASHVGFVPTGDIAGLA